MEALFLFTNFGISIFEEWGHWLRICDKALRLVLSLGIYMKAYPETLLDLLDMSRPFRGDYFNVNWSNLL